MHNCAYYSWAASRSAKNWLALLTGQLACQQRFCAKFWKIKAFVTVGGIGGKSRKISLRQSDPISDLPRSAKRKLVTVSIEVTNFEIVDVPLKNRWLVLTTAIICRREQLLSFWGAGEGLTANKPTISTSVSSIKSSASTSRSRMSDYYKLFFGHIKVRVM